MRILLVMNIPITSQVDTKNAMFCQSFIWEGTRRKLRTLIANNS